MGKETQVTVAPNQAMDEVRNLLGDPSGNGMTEETLKEFKDELYKERADTKKKKGREEYRAWQEIEDARNKAIRDFRKALTAIDKKGAQHSRNLLAFLRGKPAPLPEKEENNTEDNPSDNS
jgi:hypothetical protein